MRADRSAYDVLGLEPDADLAEIERAYKRLIKLHHPDRRGGDADRATQINRAYRELRGRPGARQALDFHEDEVSGRGRGWVNAAFIALIVVGGLFLATGPGAALIRQLSPKPTPDGFRGASASGRDVMDQPLGQAPILAGARDAMSLMRRRDDSALLAVSRDCYRRLRVEPTVARLDRCASFDDAVVQLQNRDPISDGGPFSPVAVTGRQWSAAAALSNDYLAVDGRLDRIRLQVELALAPREPPVPQQQPQR